MKAREVGGLDPAGSFRANAMRIVAARLEELNDLAEEALEPTGEAAQHDMRIAAKRLRYALEISGQCLGSRGSALHGAARRLQSVLGDIHDCDVMLPRVAGVDSVEALLRGRRDLLFTGFRDLWESEQTQSALRAGFLLA